MAEEERWLFSEEEMARIRRGMPVEEDLALRRSALRLVNEVVGDLYKGQADQTVVSGVAAILFHRYFARKSLNDGKDRNFPFHLAMAALLLGGKARDLPKRVRDLVRSYMVRHLKMSEQAVRSDSKEFFENKEAILKSERKLLHVTEFELDVTLPHNLVRRYVNPLGGSRDLLQKSVRVARTILMNTTLCVRVRPRHIAQAAVFVGTRLLGLTLPTEAIPAREIRPWREVLCLPRDELNKVLRDLQAHFQYAVPNASQQVMRALRQVTEEEVPDIADEKPEEEEEEEGGGGGRGREKDEGGGGREKEEEGEGEEEEEREAQAKEEDEDAGGRDEELEGAGSGGGSGSGEEGVTENGSKGGENGVGEGEKEGVKRPEPEGRGAEEDGEPLAKRQRVDAAVAAEHNED